MLKHVLAGLIVAAAMASGAVAGPLEDGEAAYQRGDYATARMLWAPIADRGNASVQHKLGYMYEKGQGVPQDYAQ